MIFSYKEDFTYIGLASKQKTMKLAVYIIKIRNIQEADKLELVRQEREKQVSIAASFIGNEKEFISLKE